MNEESLLGAWNTGLQSSFQDLWGGVIKYIPNILVAIIIFILGWVVGIILGQWVSKLIKSLQADKALKNIGAEEVLGKAGFRLDAGAFVGGLVKWFVIVAFLVASFNVLGLDQVNQFLNDKVLSFLPNLIIASLILILAAKFADVLARIVMGSAKAAGVNSVGIFGAFTKWAIWLLAIFAVIGQLGILGQDGMGGLASAVIQYMIMAIALAFGLAFGLGGKEAAARYLDHIREDIKSHHHN